MDHFKILAAALDVEAMAQAAAEAKAVGYSEGWFILNAATKQAIL